MFWEIFKLQAIFKRHFGFVVAMVQKRIIMDANHCISVAFSFKYCSQLPKKPQNRGCFELLTRITNNFHSHGFVHISLSWSWSINWWLLKRHHIHYSYEQNPSAFINNVSLRQSHNSTLCLVCPSKLYLLLQN